MSAADLPSTAVALSITDLGSRLLLAAAVGAAIGFNADRNRRPAGMRLYATVGLLGAMIALLMLSSGAAVPGTPAESTLAMAAALLSCSFIVGLICLGLILQQGPYARPTPGLTAASSLALVAILGLAAGSGAWLPCLVGGGIALLLLKGGRFLRDRARRLDNPL